jgi:hypothetical protein
MTNSILSIWTQGPAPLPRRPVQRPLQHQGAGFMAASRLVTGIPGAGHAGAAIAGAAAGPSSPQGQRRGPSCRLQPPAAPSWEELLGRR